MPRLIFAGRQHPHQGDVDRIVEVCRDAGYEISPTDAQAVWEAASASMAAGWLMLPDDDADLLRDVRAYCREEE